VNASRNRGRPGTFLTEMQADGRRPRKESSLENDWLARLERMEAVLRRVIDISLTLAVVGLPFVFLQCY